MRKFGPGNGRSKGFHRNRLTEKFFEDLHSAWLADGVAALKICARRDPTRFVAMCATLMPKDVTVAVSGPLTELSDQEIVDALEAVRRLRAEMVNPVIDVDVEPTKALIDARDKDE